MNRGFKAIIAFWLSVFVYIALLVIFPKAVVGVTIVVVGTVAFIAAFTLLNILIWDKFKDKEDK